MNLIRITATCLFTACILFSSVVSAQQHHAAEPDTTDKIDKIIMDRITVVGTPVWANPVPGAASYVSAEQLERQNYSDINRILRSVSGVNVQEEDGFGLRPNIGLRGAGMERSTKINLMEDGVLVAPAPYSAPAAYYFPSMSRINSVEVRKGSSQIKYGPNTTGGAINLISTPIPAEMSGRAELSMGERSSNKLYANFGNRTGRTGYLVEVLHMADDGFKQLDNNGDTGYTLRDIMGKFMFRSSDNASVYQRVELKVGYNKQLSDETYLGLSREDFANNPMHRYAASQVDQIDVEQFQISARHFALFSDNIDVTTTLYRQDVSRAWYKLHDLDTSVESINNGNLSEILRNPDRHPVEIGYLRGQDSPDNALNVRNNNRNYYSHGIQSILGINFDWGSASNQVEFGVRLHQDEEDRFQFEDGYRMQNGMMIRTSEGVPGTQANRIGSATALSFFVQNKINYDRWTFSPGVRFETIRFNNRNYGSEDLDRTGSNLSEHEYTVNEFVPGIGITYELADSFTIISGIHKGFSPPSPGSSSETRSEQSVNYELGFRYADHLIKTELIGFYNNYSNLLGSDLAAGGGGGTTAQFNAGEVRVYGIEFLTQIDFADLTEFQSVTLPVNLNYTYTNAAFQSDFESSFGPWGTVSTGDKIPFIPRHQMSASLGFGYNNFSVHLNSVYSPQIRTVAGRGPVETDLSTDEYFLLDLSSDYKISSNLTAFVNIRNILDETYIVSDRPAGVRPGLPRTFMGGMRVSI
jgi:Fe(3+) dicitrate transport protein